MNQTEHIAALEAALRKWAGHVPEVQALLGDRPCDECGQVVSETKTMAHLLTCSKFRRA